MMLAGFEAPSAGAIRIDGRAVDAVPPRKRNIGMVFQNYALFPHMTVGANLAFPLQVRGLDRAAVAERVHRALRLVRLEGFEDRHPNHSPAVSSSGWPSQGRWCSSRAWC